MKAYWLTIEDGNRLKAMLVAARQLVQHMGEAWAWQRFGACVRDTGKITLYEAEVVLETTGPLEEL